MEEHAAYQVLARKYRPATFADLIGQDAMVRTLRNAFRADRIAQAFILTGTLNLEGWIVGAQAFFKGKAVQLFDRGQSSGAGRFGQALRVAMHEIRLNISLLGRLKITVSAGQKRIEVFEVTTVRQ